MRKKLSSQCLTGICKGIFNLFVYDDSLAQNVAPVGLEAVVMFWVSASRKVEGSKDEEGLIFIPCDQAEPDQHFQGH